MNYLLYRCYMSAIDDDAHEEVEMHAVVGIILDGRRLTDAEVREACAKGAEWFASNPVEGAPRSRPNR
jgi:hypothetical protein